jgi:transcriptional regulator with XRE-family HTH domain
VASGEAYRSCGTCISDADPASRTAKAGSFVCSEPASDRPRRLQLKGRLARQKTSNFSNEDADMECCIPIWHLSHAVQLKKRPKQVATVPSERTWISAARRRRGLTQKDVASRLRLTQASYSKIESGRSGLSFELARRLAHVFEIPLQWALTRTFEPGDRVADLVYELRHYGITDLRAGDAPLPGAFRGVEQVVALALRGRPSPRIVDALPWVLLSNVVRPEVLVGYGRSLGVAQRVAWICDVALALADRGQGRTESPDVAPNLVAVIGSIHPDGAAVDDAVGRPAEDPSRLPTQSKRRRISYDATLADFEARIAELSDA